MTPAKKLAAHRFGEFKGVSPLNPLVIPPKGGIQSNFKMVASSGFRVSARNHSKESAPRRDRVYGSREAWSLPAPLFPEVSHKG